ncbi:hypothetical protein [Burkholderia vietnamiensis]|uniref:hypothetical protein n=1 Tax=Burkholderia vietnamiensis TaxID=60552 RepID=UPI00264FC78E|nr:hypothetical protein [Burkholderia vietnamiensis]MDN8037421.1 hypothetical protein [Burkholderia vietnamiensis]
MKNLAILAVLAVSLGASLAHADYRLVDTDKHNLPTHSLQWSDSLDVIVDLKNNNVCYVARQSDSHALQMQCLPIHR